MNVHHAIYLLLIGLISVSCATGKRYVKGDAGLSTPPLNESPLYTLYAIGDAGELNDRATATMNALANMSVKNLQPGTILFLGDNIYPAGLAPTDQKEARAYGEQVLKAQINSLAGYKGEVIYIPGNHDWNEFHAGGLEAIKRQGDFIDGLGLQNVQVLPQNGCGGPVVKELLPGVVLLIIDSQWWIQDWTGEPGINEGCSTGTRESLVQKVGELVRQYSGKHILIAMHHPVYSRGAHGGYFTAKDHLFPLTRLKKWLYLPLPVIGSIYPWSRQLLGHPQDQSGKAYKALQKALLEQIGDQHVIFLAGHEHNLEYLEYKGQEVLVSGSGSKHNAVANGKSLIYGHEAAGYMTLEFFSGGRILLTVYEINGDSNLPEAVFKRQLKSALEK